MEAICTSMNTHIHVGKEMGVGIYVDLHVDVVVVVVVAVYQPKLNDRCCPFRLEAMSAAY